MDVCLSEKTANTWGELESKPLRWSKETPFTFLMALGSDKKPLTKTHYGKGISISQPESNFLLPQRKNVLMGIKVCFKKDNNFKFFTSYSTVHVSNFNPFLYILIK